MESLSPRALALAELVARSAAAAQIHAVATVKALARGAARRWQGHQDLRRLQDLDDRLLEDIGVERYEIARAVGKAPWLDYRVR
ncbi:MAG: DUF1127 domain-containing protein [Rhodospirillales bacterium]|nr:DUF1127 domain-containing protein [Rhodospirillales bacterium]